MFHMSQQHQIMDALFPKALLHLDRMSFHQAIPTSCHQAEQPIPHRYIQVQYLPQILQRQASNMVPSHRS